MPLTIINCLEIRGMNTSFQRVMARKGCWDAFFEVKTLDGYLLGYAEIHPRFDIFMFEPRGRMVYDETRLRDIADFLDQQNENYRIAKS